MVLDSIYETRLRIYNLKKKQQQQQNIQSRKKKESNNEANKQKPCHNNF